MLELLFGRADGLDPLRLGLVALSLAISVAYLGPMVGPASPTRTAVKTAAIATLAVLPLTYLGAPGVIALTLALSLSALGDYFLALENQSRFFVPGLSAFLAAHIAYLIAFLPHTGTPGWLALAAIAGAMLAAGNLLIAIAPKLGRLRLPVFAYFTVIMAMVAAALSIKAGPWYLGAGAVVFALSDSLIAVRKFLNPFPLINEAVWITYIAAQFMMTAGLLKLIVT